MKAQVTVVKSFDHDEVFTKNYEDGDFEEFLKEEGKYVDRLSRATEAHGKSGEGFTITYTISLEK